MILRERYRRLPKTDPRNVLLEKQGQIRLKTRIEWREINRRRSLMEKEYKSEEIKPPLEPWKATTLRFDVVEPKEQYTNEKLKALTEKRFEMIEADIFI